MSETHTILTGEQVTFTQPPPAGSKPVAISNSIVENVIFVTASSIQEPDNTAGTNSTNGTVFGPSPYTPPDVFTQNKKIGQLAPLNWTNGSWS
jgi:hypothetical protein